MRGEQSRALLCIVSVDGRACSESELSNVALKVALGDWKGELWQERSSLLQGWGDAGRRTWGWRKYSQLSVCGTLAIPAPAEPPQKHWAGPGVHSTGNKWELCAPRKTGVNTCWVLGGSLESPSQPTQVSLLCGIISSHEPWPCTFVICFFLFWQTVSLWRKSGKSRADWPVLFDQIRGMVPTSPPVCAKAEAQMTSLYLSLLKLTSANFSSRSVWLFGDNGQSIHNNCLFSLFTGAQEITVQLFKRIWTLTLSPSSLKDFPEVARNISWGSCGFKIFGLMK